MPRYFTAGEARAALVLCVLAVLGAWLGRFIEDRSRARTLDLQPVCADSLARHLVERELARHNAPVRINTAPETDLTRLEGIGPALAGRIIAERERGGRYLGPEDLAARVGGIGPSTVARLAGKLDFGVAPGEALQ